MLMAETLLTPSKQLVLDVSNFVDDPLGFVYFALPWGEGDHPLNITVPSAADKMGCPDRAAISIPVCLLPLKRDPKSEVILPFTGLIN